MPITKSLAHIPPMGFKEFSSKVDALEKEQYRKYLNRKHGHADKVSPLRKAMKKVVDMTD
jgi:hypothetical protein